MTEKTLTWVSAVGSEPDRFGNYYLNVAFADETVGYIGGKAERIEHLWTAFTDLIGKPIEFQLEEKGLSGKGKPKFKIISYGGTAGALSPPSTPLQSRRSIEMEEFIQERMDRRTALMQAVTIGSGITTELAEKFYRWLRAPLETSASQTGEGEAPVTSGAEDGSEGVGVAAERQASAPSDPPRRALGWETKHPERK